MKYSFRIILLQCLTLSVLWASDLPAQSAKSVKEVKIDLNLQNVTVVQALKVIESKTDYRFTFDGLSLNNDKRSIKLRGKNLMVYTYLKAIASQTGLNFRQYNNSISVKKAIQNLDESEEIEVIIQTSVVSGRVTAADMGEGLPGVNVVEKGTDNGTVTDIQGDYTIEVAEGATLVFSSVGYTTTEVAIGNRSTIDLTLQTDVTELEELVVVGYGTQIKRNVTGSIATVDGDQIASKPVPNALSALQGEASGVLVTNSGRAGEAPTIRIRGIGSINGISPLYIVDGIFTDNIDFLNPADIASVEILKDPSTLAVFGVQGANGAIIITTKKAKEGETTVNFTSYAGFQAVQDRIGLTNAEQFKTLYNEQLANLGAAPFDFSQYGDTYTNWQDEILRTGFITNNSLSFRSGTEKNQLSVGFSYLNQEGVQKYDEYTRYTLRLRNDFEVSDHVRIGGDINGYKFDRNPTRIGITSALWAAPVFAPKDENGNWVPSPTFQRAQVGNPVAFQEIYNGKTIDEGFRLIGSAWLELNFLEKFTWKSTFYGDWSFNENRSYNPIFEIGTGDERAQFNEVTSVRQGMSRGTNYQMDHILTYNDVIGDKHNITVLGGIITREVYDVNVGGFRQSEPPINIPDNPRLWYLNIGQANTTQTNAGGASDEAFLSFLGRANYSYDNKYLLNLTYRRDGSSKFGIDNRWGNFGSVGAGWVVSEENFFNYNFIDFLKVKASWGALGNDKIGLYRQYPTLNIGEGAVFGENVFFAVSPNYIVNPNMKWETIVGYDVGFELVLFDDRLSADFSYYNRESTDLLVTVELPGTTGLNDYLLNLGSIVNKGIELSLDWSDNITSDLRYTLRGNVTTNDNEVTSIGDDITFQLIRGNSWTLVGEPVGSFYGYIQDGIFQTPEEIAGSDQPDALPGDMIFRDINDDGVIDDGDRTNIGSPNPDIFYGASLALYYKNFDFSIEMQGVGGNHIYRERSRSRFAILNYEEERLGRWVGPGTSNTEPILDDTRTRNYEHSTYFLDPGDYFRIRNLSLGYNFSLSLMQSLNIKNAKIYINAQNPITWHKARNYSPEVSGGGALRSGVDDGVYPVPSTYSLGLNVNF